MCVERLDLGLKVHRRVPVRYKVSKGVFYLGEEDWHILTHKGDQLAVGAEEVLHMFALKSSFVLFNVISVCLVDEARVGALN